VLKAKLQQFLRRHGMYERMRETFAYDCYRRWKDGRPVSWRRQELKFYQRLLGPLPAGSVIFDVGANRGQRTRIFQRLGAKVVAVEPDRSNQALLARRFGPGGREAQVVLVGKAVSEAEGTTTLWVHEPGSGLNSLSPKWVETLASDDVRFGRRLEFAERQEVQTTTLAALIREFGLPRYIKVDVEGHEPSVLRGLNQAVPCVSFEVNLPEFLAEGLECVALLARLSPAGRFNWTLDCRGEPALPLWLGAGEFAAALRECRAPSIEAFWQSPEAAGGHP
jgi:FkbM family methyltransferase